MMTDVDGKAMIIPLERYGIKLLSIGLLVDEKNAVVWRGPMASSAIRQFITDVKWGELDYLIIDMPPGTGDIHLTMMQTAPVTGVVVVTTPQDVALADAKKGIAMFGQAQMNVPIIGLFMVTRLSATGFAWLSSFLVVSCVVGAAPGAG